MSKKKSSRLHKMQSTTPNLLRSTPDLTLDPVDKMQRDNWRTSSASMLHHKNSPIHRPLSSSPSTENHGSFRRPCDVNSGGDGLLSSPVRRSRAVSPHHNRSLSFRTMKRPTPQQMQDSDAQDNDEFRSRGATMPSDSASYYLARRRIRSRLRDDQKNPSHSPPIHEPGDEEDDEYYLLRIFNINSKGGIVNQGDYIRQRSKSNNSVSSVGSAGGATSGASNATSYSSGGQGRGPKCKVAILGSIEVGKTAIINQFMTSEYMNTYETQDEDMEKCVSVLLDGIEYELLFVDNPSPVENAEGEVVVEESDAYVVVYSVTERRSFEKSVDILFGLKEHGLSSKKAVILVGNKSDLARSREVATEEGKSIASSYECKFIETSAGINHNVDELLVGIVSQIRLKLKQKLDLQNPPPPSTGSPFRKWGSTRANFRSSLKAKGIFNKILGKSTKRSKSCENLHVL